MKSEYRVNNQLSFSFDGNVPVTGGPSDFFQVLIRKVKDLPGGNRRVFSLAIAGPHRLEILKWLGACVEQELKEIEVNESGKS